MSKYKFDEQKHVHTLNDKPLHGVTSVLKMWGDPNPLLNWGVKTAVDYIEESSPKTQDENGWYQEVSTETLAEARTAHLKKRDKAGDKGTEVHAELEEIMNKWIDGQEPYPGKATHCVDKVLDWMIGQNITPLASEMNVYSKTHWFGGIADGVIEKDGKKYILDFKTSGTVQTKYFYQMGAYSLAVKEMKPEAEVAGAVIVHIPRGKSFNPEKNVYWRYDIEELEQAFLNILNVYKLDREVSKLLTY